MNHKTQNPRLIFLIIVALMLTQLACNAVTGGSARPTSDAPRATEDRSATATPQTQVAFPKIDRPNPQPQSSDPGIACIGTFGFGVTCIENNEWVTYTRDTSDLGGDQIHDIVVCPDKQLLVAHTFGISAYDGTRWKLYDPGWGVSSVEALACDDRGDIWVAHFKGVSHFNGDSWNTFGAQEYLAFGDAANNRVRDVTIAPNGTIWVVTANSVAQLEDGEWIVYQEGQGFDDKYYFENIILDADGRPWVTCTRGLLVLDNGTWRPYFNRDISSPKGVAIDKQGRVWVGTLSKGIFALETGGWLSYNYENGALSSNDVRQIEVDGQGRVWVATEWGLNILEDEEWRTYQMGNSDIADNSIYVLSIVDGGPVLSPPQTKEPGSLSGKIVDERGRPIKEAIVEICVERMFGRFREQTPCTGQPFHRSVNADNTGNFTVTELPPGRYVLAFYDGERWTHLTGEFGNASERILVEPGERTDLGEITFVPLDE